MSRSESRLPIIGLLALSLLSAACNPSVGDAGRLGTPAPGTATPAATNTAPMTAGPSTAPTPPTSPTPVASPTPGAPASPASPAPATSLVIYLLSDGRLLPVYRQVPHTVGAARAAMTALLAGPTASESSSSASLSTLIPSATQLLDIGISNGTATVDLSGDFQSGTSSVLLDRLAQVTYTLTQFQTVQRVAFRVDGQPVTAFSGTGIGLARPAQRSDYLNDLPAIFVDRPAWGSALGNPARITGLANVFEAQFRVEIYAASGALIASQAVQASCGSGCWGTFAATVPYGVATQQTGRLTVYDISMRDGSRVDVRSYSVILTPAS